MRPLAMAACLLLAGGPASAAPEGETPVAEAEAAPTGWTFGGSADFYLSHNTRDPRGGRNRYHYFTAREGGGPHLGLVDLWAEHPRRPVGGRLDLNWGPNALRANAAEPGDDLLWRHVQQAYVGVDLSRDGRTYLEAGKWITPAGAEVAEPVDNVFHGQGLLFSLSAPFFHLGVRGVHRLEGDDYVMAHVHRGWDAVSSPGHGPGFGLTWARGFAPGWLGTFSYLGGEEGAGGGAATWRHFGDVILEYEPEASAWSGLANLQAGRQEGVRIRGRRREAAWFGVMALAAYEVDPRGSVGARVEWFHDGSGFLAGNDGELYSLAVNYTRRVGPHLQLRAEYRHDFAGGSRPFPGSRAGWRFADQGVFGLAAIVGF